jgi:hypothetical protein
MPCSFSGVFFVISKNKNTLNCLVKDEMGERTYIEMRFHLQSDKARPIPAKADFFQTSSAYFIAGDFAIVNGTKLSVLSLYKFTYASYR